MYAQVEKPKENTVPAGRQESRAVANSVVQKKSNGTQGFGFVDNRSALVEKSDYRKLMSNNAIQRKFDDTTFHKLTPSKDSIFGGSITAIEKDTLLKVIENAKAIADKGKTLLYIGVGTGNIGTERFGNPTVGANKKDVADQQMPAFVTKPEKVTPQAIVINIDAFSETTYEEKEGIHIFRVGAKFPLEGTSEEDKAVLKAVGELKSKVLDAQGYVAILNGVTSTFYKAFAMLTKAKRNEIGRLAYVSSYLADPSTSNYEVYNNFGRDMYLKNEVESLEDMADVFMPKD